MNINKDLIRKREAELEKASNYLKTQFIGIDAIIDKFINSVKVWYIMPEIQTRPLIINLWGITGVGKTDLIRKFAKVIDFNDRFTEIQMDSKSGSGNIEDYLESTFESNETQGILLLDEFQRFRTIQEDGKENSSNKYQDLWMLLSDGIFKSNANIKQELMQVLLDDKYWAERDDDFKKELEDNNKRTYKIAWWDASQIKRLLKIPDSIPEIMKWDGSKRMKLVKDRLNNGETYEGKKYSKLLIVISGNLDEAFTMSSSVSDADRDADVYHDYSKSINIINIKDALTDRFKPEQIARLGNTHLIYPIPNKRDYERIIKQKVDSVLDVVENKNGIKINVDQSVLDGIYVNGVFPTQGVRPIISTVSSMIENSVPKFIYSYLMTDSGGDIDIKFRNGQLISNINGEDVVYDVPTVLEDIKEGKTRNENVLTSVHEAGHAVLYAILFKTAPTQIVATTINRTSYGFIGIHSTNQSRKQILDEVKITFGGRISESLVFGEKYITDGASGDYEHATTMIGDYVRTNGLDDNIGVYCPLPKNDGTLKTNVDITDEVIEGILFKLYSEAEYILNNNIMFLKEVINNLIKKTSLTPTEFKIIADKYVDGGIRILDPSKNVEEDYSELYDKFLSKL